MHFLTDSVETFVAEIFMSGPIELAKHHLRAECMRKGLCVTIAPTEFIYTGGEERGFVIGLRNYPRFPESSDDIRERAIAIAKKLIVDLHQRSAMVVAGNETIWIRTPVER